MKAYLIPGFMEDRNSRNYDSVMNIYKSAGLDPRFVPIDWKYKTIEDWVEQVKSRLPKDDIENSLLSGFSFGAVIALSLAGYYQNPRRLFLFSLSCFYSEDQIRLPKSWLKSIGNQRAESFKAINFDELASHISCPTNIFVGTKEGSEMLLRAKIAHKKIQGSRINILSGVNHDVTDKKYVDAIRSTLHSK